MKIYVIIIAILFFSLNSCDNEIKQKESVIINKGEVKEDKQEVEKIGIKKKTEINGLWLNKEYYSNIIKFKDPRKYQESSEISFLKIDSSANKILIAWNFHEGINGNLKNINSKYYFEENPIEFKNNELIYKENRFVKLDGVDNDSFILNKLIFNGKYLSESDTVVFYKNGKIKGLKGFKFYQPIIDYMDSGMDVNQLYLGKESTNHYINSELFGFDFENDTLIIYELECSEKIENDCMIVKFGEIKEKLIKLEQEMINKNESPTKSKNHFSGVYSRGSLSQVQHHKSF